MDLPVPKSPVIMIQYFPGRTLPSQPTSHANSLDLFETGVKKQSLIFFQELIIRRKCYSILKVRWRKYFFILRYPSLKCPYMLAGHASGCWISALGAGVPYNREKTESLVCNHHSYKNLVKSEEVYRIQGDRYLTCVTIRSFCVTATKPSTCIETITDRTAYST